MNTNMLIVAAVVIALLIGAFFLFCEATPVNDEEAVEGFGSELFDKAQDPASEAIQEATDAVPETNPLERVETNPFKGKTNPFAQ